MPVASKIVESIQTSSWIRKMFEEGAKLKAEFGEENVFDFSLGNPDVPPPEEFFSMLKKLMHEDMNATKIDMHGYMPNAGFMDVRDSVASKLSNSHKVQLDPQNIIMTCGAAGGLNVVLKTILDPEDQVIVPRPYFAEYGFYIDNHRGEIILADTNEDFSLNIDNIRNKINPKTRAVLINSPNNPTGKVYTEKEIKGLSDLLKDASHGRARSIYCIADEPYREIVYDDVIVPSIFKFYDNSIIVSSYSKSLSIPGERIGYIALNPQCSEISTLVSGLILSNRILGFVNAPALMQRVIAGMPDVSVNIEAYKRRRDIIMKGLVDAGYQFTPPEGAFYIFCKSPIEDDVQFVKHLQEHKILAVPGVGFGGPGYFRLSYAVPEDMINKSLPIFKEVLESL